MDIKQLVIKEIKRKSEIKVSEIEKKTGFSRAYINRFLKELKDDGKIILVGKSNRAHYILAKGKSINSKKMILNVRYALENNNLKEDEILNKIEKDTGIIFGLPKNTVSIIEYAFTEMLNNAIDHSKSKKINVIAEKESGFIRFNISDKGIGIFNSIIKKYSLRDELEAIQELTKGKLTTAPKMHSGEGIFFTSRIVDKLIIQSSKKRLIFDNIINDVFIEDIKTIKGTKVMCDISVRSKRILESVFREYASEGFEFSKTKVLVKLYRVDTNYISRSQARRILVGLEKFKTIILDFNKINTIGQGFADEIFRVWKSNHPKIDIQYQNANENIIFMIERTGVKVELK